MVELLSESKNLVQASFGFQLIKEFDKRVLGLENLSLCHKLILLVYFNSLNFKHVVLPFCFRDLRSGYQQSIEVFDVLEERGDIVFVQASFQAEAIRAHLRSN